MIIKIKNILSCLCIILLCNFTYSQSISDLDEKNGFRNFILGENKWKYLFYSIDYKRVEGDYLYYDLSLDEDDRKIGNYKFSDIKLVFYKDQLYKIKIYFGWQVGRKNLLGVSKVIMNKYGNPSEIIEKNAYYRKFIEKHILWYGNEVELDIKYYVIPGKNEDVAPDLSMYYPSIDKEEDLDKMLDIVTFTSYEIHRKIWNDSRQRDENALDDL